MGNKIYELNNGNGTIKKYDSKGRIIFEIEYVNGERNGKSKCLL